MPDTVQVKSALPQQKDGGWPVAFHERDDAHPDGEVFIADDKIHEVGYTAAVKLAISNGSLEMSDAKPTPPSPPPPPPSGGAGSDKDK